MPKPQLSPFGQYPGQAMVGFFDDGFANSDPANVAMGARLSAVIPNCNLIDTGGNLWNVARYAVPGEAGHFRILTNADGNALHCPHAASAQAFGGAVAIAIDQHSHVIADAQGNGANDLWIERTRESIRWCEAGILDIAGPRLCAPMSAFMSGPTGPWGFASCIARVSGTLLGRTVNGFIEHTSVWATTPDSFGQLHDRETAIWIIICNEYDNGEYHFLNVAAMRNGTTFALVADHTGPLMTTCDVRLAASVDGRGYPEIIEFAINGEPWIWTPCPNSDISDPAGPFKRDREGIARRVGDSRIPRLTFGWVNFFNDERMAPYLR